QYLVAPTYLLSVIMGEPLQKLTMMGENIQPQSSSSDDVVEISLISSEDDKQESSSIQEINTPNAKNNSETFPKVDPCLLCAQPAVEYDGEGKPIMNQKGREQAPSTIIVASLASSARDSASNPFTGWCESLINNLAGVYTRLEAIKTELKDRMEDGEEIYMREELYSKQNVRYFNFRKLVLGAKFQGTVKGRMFQRNHPQSPSGLTRPTCFDESMFPPNHPGSQSLLKTTNADAEGNGSSSSSSSSSSPAVPPPPSPRKKWKGATSRIPPVASLSQGSSSTTNSLKPAGIGATFDPTRFHRFSKRKPPVPSPLKRNPPNLTPVYIPDTSGFMERCPDSGKITYYSSGATKKARQILSFTPPHKTTSTNAPSVGNSSLFSTCEKSSSSNSFVTTFSNSTLTAGDVKCAKEMEAKIRTLMGPWTRKNLSPI
ncbi:hypothetical protein Ocin01_17447, partial [Orchesella cincta]